MRTSSALVALIAALVNGVHASPIRLHSRQASNSSSLEWSSCGEDRPPSLECTQLEVPMDWSNPGGQKISLGISRVRATSNSSRIGSLVFNPGGPGGSATRDCELQALGVGLFTDSLAAHYDIVCPDPRGVATSNGVQCDPDLWNTRQTLFPQDNATYDEMTNHYKAFGESCLNLTGDLVRYVDTVSVARDFEALRAALNEGMLNYLGISYGTQIGATYAELYPQNIGAMALDGILDHSASEAYFLISESETYEHVLDRFFDWCATTEECPLQGQNVSQIFDDLVQQADTAPIPALDCLPDSNTTRAGTCFANVTGEDIRFNTQGLLLIKNSKPPLFAGWANLGQALSDAMNGNATLLSSPLAQSQNSSIWQGLAVGCLDWNRNQNFADNMYKQQLTGSVSPHTRGAAQSYTYEAQCAGWPIPASNPQHPLNATAMALTPPILLVNAYYDPSTSYTWAQSIKEQVPNGELLTRNGDGHTSYFLGGEATAAIDAFLINGTMPAANTVVQT